MGTRNRAPIVAGFGLPGASHQPPLSARRKEAQPAQCFEHPLAPLARQHAKISLRHEEALAPFAGEQPEVRRRIKHARGQEREERRREFKLDAGIRKHHRSGREQMLNLRGFVCEEINCPFLRWAAITRNDQHKVDRKPSVARNSRKAVGRDRRVRTRNHQPFEDERRVARQPQRRFYWGALNGSEACPPFRINPAAAGSSRADLDWDIAVADEGSEVCPPFRIDALIADRSRADLNRDIAVTDEGLLACRKCYRYAAIRECDSGYRNGLFPVARYGCRGFGPEGPVAARGEA